jgi:phenylpropionate dioxygenase-like ring-hydroxylating dioxygenase large terminal subunit
MDHLRTAFAKTRLPVEQATTLPPETYRSPEYHQHESRELFGRSWVCVGYTCQVDQPGKMLTAMVDAQPIVVTRDKQNELRAFYNVCRHRGSILIENDTKAERFRCPYHSWTYDLSGKLQNCPLFANENFCKDNYNLLPVRVSTWGCFIFVNLDDHAEPLSDYLGDLPSRYANFPLKDLVLVRRKNYSIQSNWKLIAENFLEYYHLPWVHPELCEVAAIDMHKRNQGPGMYMSFYASPLLKGNTPLDADYLPAMPGLSETEQNSGYFPYLFPNLALFLLPHHLFTLIANPTSAGHTQEYGDLLVHPSVLNESEKIDEIFKFYDMVNAQDITAVERVQRGVQARPYDGGRMCHRFEEPVHRFQNMVIDFVTGERRFYAGD